MKILDQLKYAKTDEWVSVDGKVATIGVSDYAQEQLSDIVFVEVTPSVGETIKKDAVFATLESVKAAADVVMPVSGKVLEVNEALSNTPEVVNADAYGKAWLIKVEMSDPGELDNLLDAKAYEKFCEERSH
jgi:glycine cleavage system H protein